MQLVVNWPMYGTRGMKRLDEVEMLMLPLIHGPWVAVAGRLDLHNLTPWRLRLSDDVPWRLRRLRGNPGEIHQAYRMLHPMGDQSDPRNESLNPIAGPFGLSWVWLRFCGFGFECLLFSWLVGDWPEVKYFVSLGSISVRGCLTEVYVFFWPRRII